MFESSRSEAAANRARTPHVRLPEVNAGVRGKGVDGCTFVRSQNLTDLVLPPALELVLQPVLHLRWQRCPDLARPAGGPLPGDCETQAESSNGHELQDQTLCFDLHARATASLLVTGEHALHRKPQAVGEAIQAASLDHAACPDRNLR